MKVQHPNHQSLHHYNFEWSKTATVFSWRNANHFLKLQFDNSSVCETRSISARSVQLSPTGSQQGWELLAGQSESRKFLCPNMEGLCAALKSAGKIHVQCFSKIYSSVSWFCDNQSLQSHLLGSKNEKKKY